MTRERIKKAQQAMIEVILNEEAITEMIKKDELLMLREELEPCYPAVIIAAHAAMDDSFDTWLRREMGIETSDLLITEAEIYSLNIPDEVLDQAVKPDEEYQGEQIEESFLPEDAKDAALSALAMMIALRCIPIMGA